MIPRMTKRLGTAIVTLSLLGSMTTTHPLRAQEERPADLVGCGVDDGTHTVNFLRETGGFWFQNGLYNLSPESTTNGGPRLDQLTVPVGGTLAAGLYEVYAISADDHLQNPLDPADTAPFEQFAIAVAYGTADESVSTPIPDLPDDAQWQSDGTFTDPIPLQLIPGAGSPLPPVEPVTPAPVEASRPGAPLGLMTVTDLTTDVSAIHATVLDPTLVPEPRAFGNSIVPWEAAFVCVGDVAVTKSVDADAAQPGVPFTWTLTVTADEPAPATGLRLEDPLPPGLSVSGDPTADIGSVEVTEDGILRWTGDLDAGATATITVTTVVADAAAYDDCVGDGETCTNTASLVEHVDADAANDRASASVAFLDVLVETTLPPAPDPPPPAPTPPPIEVLDTTAAPPAVAQTATPTFNG